MEVVKAVPAVAPLVVDVLVVRDVQVAVRDAVDVPVVARLAVVIPVARRVMQIVMLLVLINALVEQQHSKRKGRI